MGLSSSTYERRRKEGICTQCGASIEGDLKNRVTGTKRSMCRVCLKENADKLSRYRKERALNGLCERCGQRPPRENRKNCAECALYLAASGKKRSERTFFDKRARNAGLKDGTYGTIGLAKILAFQWKHQRGKCALTGRRLDRYNSEVDHIIPRTRGGATEKNNLRWLHKETNQAKRNLMDDEFIKLCKEVVEHKEI